MRAAAIHQCDAAMAVCDQSRYGIVASCEIIRIDIRDGFIFRLSDRDDADSGMSVKIGDFTRIIESGKHGALSGADVAENVFGVLDRMLIEFRKIHADAPLERIQRGMKSLQQPADEWISFAGTPGICTDEMNDAERISISFRARFQHECSLAADPFEQTVAHQRGERLPHRIFTDAEFAEDDVLRQEHRPRRIFAALQFRKQIIPHLILFGRRIRNIHRSTSPDTGYGILKGKFRFF